MARSDPGVRAAGRHRHASAEHGPPRIRLTRRGRYVLGAVCAGSLTMLAFLPGRAAPSTGVFGTTTAARPAEPMRVLAFGDSVPSGYACDCQSFVPMYADLLHRQSNRVTSWTNFAASGLVSADLLVELNTPPVVDAVHRAATVLIMIGANDFALAFSQVASDPHAVSQFAGVAATLRSNLTTAIRRIRSLAAPGARIAVLGYWNVEEDGQVAARDYTPVQRAASVSATTVANRAIYLAALDTGAQWVSTLPAFHGPKGNLDPTGLLAADGDHPNVAGHQAIAAAVASVVPFR